MSTIQGTSKRMANRYSKAARPVARQQPRGAPPVKVTARVLMAIMPTV